jgi:hypothetical protein
MPNQTNIPSSPAGIFKTIPIELYGVQIYVSIAQTHEDAKKCAKKYAKMPNEQFEESFGHWKDNSGVLATVAHSQNGSSLTRFKNPVIDHNTVAHECFHIAVAIMEAKNIPMADSSEEAWAYLIGFLVGKVTEVFKELEKKKNLI